jgi:uncharacterized protein (TIGR02444 family)
MIIGADSTGAAAANPLWDFSLALYARDGIAAECIALQDRHGLDVNLLLYACFAASRGVALAAADLAALESAVAAWREDMVQPLRELRRRAGGASRLRQALLDAELMAEREQQDRMWSARSPGGDWAGSAGDVSLRDNLRVLALQAGVDAAVLDRFALAVEHLLPLLLAQQ